ncbi:MAG: hypothetical protein H6518_12810 [Microthrixaceae bacterium]|nr:hypothetical protein [Microthrixaceae bacterium]
MRITERWEYLVIEDIPEGQLESLKQSYAELGYEETERGESRLVVRKEFPVTGQILID